MVKLDFTNIFKVGDNGLTKAEFKSTRKILSSYLDKIEKRKQGFYSVIDDASVVSKVEQFAKGQKGKFTSIVVLGIGGSALGTICLAQSLKHLYENEISKRSFPKLYVLDNIDPVMMKEVLDVVDLKKTLFLVVTKSGSTPEILAQYFYFRKLTDGKKLDALKHFVFITHPKVGLLRKIANEDGITAFDVPENVGGRFSVLTVVGLLPAALIGINIKNLFKGAQEMRDSFLNRNFDKNLPFQLAVVQYLLAKKGKNINVMMPYAQKLIRFSDWFRQLLAESIGKAKDSDGKTVNVGITPINALGVTDQHSQNQLYSEGPNDKLFIFLRVKKLGASIIIPLLSSDASVSYLKNTSFNNLIDVEYQGTAQALTQNKRPNLNITIDQIDETHLAQLFMLFEGAIAFLGEFFNINAFDQPGVELSKNLTKKILLAQ
ncbi:MAG: glucose-6-phosphate isomerase [Candidatus Magasanikbacteria bacterium]|nr:glucose-6-phosphate isomerase [Candidatus Magasanikbacteria bacterium]